MLFSDLGMSSTLHKINYGSGERRPRSLIDCVNSRINRISDGRQIMLDQTPNACRYEDLNEALETNIGGEHFNQRGYAINVKHFGAPLAFVKAGTRR